MNAFCVKAALSVVGRAPGRLRAGLKGGRASEREIGQRLIWSRLVCTGDGWCTGEAGDVNAAPLKSLMA